MEPAYVGCYNGYEISGLGGSHCCGGGAGGCGRNRGHWSRAQMSDLYRMRDVRPLEHIDGDGLFPPGGSSMNHVRAQLNEK